MIQVQRRNDISAIISSRKAFEDPNDCEDPRLSSLGIRWHVTNNIVAIRTVIAGTAAAKSAKIMAGDELLKVDDQQAAATVAGVNMQLAHALTTKPTVFNRKKETEQGGVNWKKKEWKGEVQ